VSAVGKIEPRGEGDEIRADFVPANRFVVAITHFHKMLNGYSF